MKTRWSHFQNFLSLLAFESLQIILKLESSKKACTFGLTDRKQVNMASPNTAIDVEFLLRWVSSATALRVNTSEGPRTMSSQFSPVSLCSDSLKG